MAITANKTWTAEVLKHSDLNNEFTHYRNYIKNNKDLILGDSAEGTGYAGHDHEGVNGVQLGTNSLENLAVTGAKIANSTITLEKLDSALSQIFASREIRAQFIWDSASSILINGAKYLHIGTTNQVVYWETQLTLTFTDLGNDTWYYIYLDDSAIVAAQTNELSIDELIYSDTAPSWDNEKCGWYNSEDRCIFAVLTDGSGNILEFWHSGDLTIFGTSILDNADPTDASAWKETTLTIPSFSTKAQITFYARHNASVSIQYRPNGSAGSGIEILTLECTGGATERAVNTFDAITDATQIIECYPGAVEPDTALYTNGWYFPIGM